MISRFRLQEIEVWENLRKSFSNGTLFPVKTCSGEIWTNWVELAGDGSGWNPLDAASALLALLVSYDS